MLRHLVELFRAKKRKTGLGLRPLPSDPRDFNLGFLGWGEYRPKSKRLILPMMAVKTQRNNTCAFNSRVSGKEADEGIPLSVEFLVKAAVGLGEVSGDGFTDLRSVEDLMVRRGVCSASLLPEETTVPWPDYADPYAVTDEQRNEAESHKSKTYWAIGDRHHIWQALDQGRTVRVGVEWRTTMLFGTIQPPHILDFKRGFRLGGHAILIIGYDRAYSGEDVFICQNSYGPNYGDCGRMYIRVRDLERQIKTYGAFCDLDLPRPT